MGYPVINDMNIDYRLNFNILTTYEIIIIKFISW